MVHSRIPRRGAMVPAALLASLLAVAGCASPGPAESPSDPPAPATPVEAPPAAPRQASDSAARTDSVTETEAAAGIFTATQADRGRTTFDEACAECHTNNEFRGRLFQSNWGRRTVYSFYRTIRSTMPDNNPGGLDEQVYLDVVSYILSLNGHEAGASELSADSPMRDVRMAPASEGDMAGKPGATAVRVHRETH